MRSKTKEDELYQGYLAKVYQQGNKIPQLSRRENELLRDQGVCVTYGELLYPSVKKLIRHLEICPEDVFFDLGSGMGKCALQLFMQSDLRHVVGIEASKALHQQSIRAANQVQKDFPIFWEDNRKLTYLCDNFLHSDWLEATIIYCCSTCFTEELLFAIGDKINLQPKIKQIYSFRPLPSLKSPLRKVFTVECSWDTTLCFFYAS